MKFEDFYSSVEADTALAGVCITEDFVIVQHVPTGIKTKLYPGAILNNHWVTLEPVLHGQENPGRLTHYTRVVGYYSAVHNWNKSKVGELRARQKGQYEIQS